MRFLIAVLLLVAVAVSLASCGEDETDTYRTTFKPVSSEIVTTEIGRAHV